MMTMIINGDDDDDEEEEEENVMHYFGNKGLTNATLSWLSTSFSLLIGQYQTFLRAEALVIYCFKTFNTHLSSAL